ncbi:MAG: hypothetical protein HQL63_12270 [Magnetococcales bacterium]|nr:hypothetical protein [Magnetococcales bacterium]MBF0322265.1 hypothetical protein [Magnetococcales bacterium]
MKPDFNTMSLKDIEELINTANHAKMERAKTSREECLARFAEVAAEYNLTIEDVVCGKVDCPSGDDKETIPASVLNNIKDLSPLGLYNPHASDGRTRFHKPDDAQRWCRVPRWLKEELTQLRKEYGSKIPRRALQALVDKYPPEG